MKNWTFILLLALLIITSGVAGFFIHQPKTVTITEPVTVPDYHILGKIDSFKTVDIVHHYVIDSLKNRLSSYSRIKPGAPIINIQQLPCDTGHIIDTLLQDIRTYQQLVISYDTLIAGKDRFTCFLRTSLTESRDIITDLQYRIDQQNKDAEKQKRQKLKIFLSGIGIGAGTILAAVLIL